MLITRRSLLAGVAAGVAVPALAPLAQAADPPVPLKMAELYGTKEDFSPRAQELAGKQVVFQGYMAPPLKPDAKFFVLTTVPMAVGPFCADISEWPEDIVVIYTKSAIEILPFDLKVNATGRLDIGPYIDPVTGFVSKVRLADASYRGVPTTTPLNTGPRVFQSGN